MNCRWILVFLENFSSISVRDLEYCGKNSVLNFINLNFVSYRYALSIQI